MTSTRVRRLIDAPRQRVFDALLDRTAIARWKVPVGMTCEMHEFETEGPALRGEMTTTITLSEADGAPSSSPCTTGCPTGSRPPTTRRAGGRR